MKFKKKTDLGVLISKLLTTNFFNHHCSDVAEWHILALATSNEYSNGHGGEGETSLKSQRFSKRAEEFGGCGGLCMSAPGLWACCPVVWSWGQTHLKATFSLSNTSDI